MIDSVIEKVGALDKQLDSLANSTINEASYKMNIDNLKSQIKALQQYLRNGPEIQELTLKQERWAKISIEQLSFFNNLLIVLGTAFLGFAFKDLGFSTYYFSIDFEIIPTSTTLSLFFVSLSIMVNLFCAFNRLLVFNHQTHILRLKKKFVENDIMPSNSCNERIFCPFRFLFLKPKFYHIEPGDFAGGGSIANQKLCKLIKLLEKFRSYTTILLNIGFVSFFLAIVFYVARIIYN